MTPPPRSRSSAERRYLEALDLFGRACYSQAKDRARAAAELALGQLRDERWGPVPVPTCSIIFVSQAAHDDVAAALARLAGYGRDPRYEVIVVDNGNAALQGLARRVLPSGRYLSPGFNFGASGGRNLGAVAAAGRYLAFIDDDGLLGEGAVEALVATISRHAAAAVRGRILPKSPGAYVGGHYDLGDQLIFSEPNTEGLCVWDKEVFSAAGGFDLLLFGHEGIKLCCDAFPAVGATGFLYDPGAVLYHDYASGSGAFAAKKQRHRRNWDYFRYCGIDHEAVIRAIREANLTSGRSGLEVTDRSVTA